jgi:hypothetical protein
MKWAGDFGSFVLLFLLFRENFGKGAGKFTLDF